jgi:cell division protein FtsZ
MTLNISVPTTTQELCPKITVIGVGGAGGNAVNNMIEANLEGIEFLAANTDGQALVQSLAQRKIQLGRQQTQGLGAGSKPEVGRTAAEESLDDILAELSDSHMVFITAGMGGGTGTGAAPVIAKAARERGILTVGVVTKPFDFEGQVRMRQANAGIEELQAYVDTLIIIPNQNLFRLANERTTFADAFAMADDVLHKGVCGITDLMIKPGDINLDFADIRSVMAEMGKAMMGTGEASGENRAANAAEAAINNPLLDETSMGGAQAVLINITGGNDMTLFEVDEAANHVRREVDTEANIIIGSSIDEKMDGIMRVSVVATGMDAGEMTQRSTRPIASTKSPRPKIMPGFTESTADETFASDSSGASAPETVMPEKPRAKEAKTVQDNETSAFDAIPTEEDPDDGQQNLEDFVAEAKRHDEEASGSNDATEDEPFIMRPTVDIPEEKAPKSLIGHIAGMFAPKTAKAEDQTSQKEPSEGHHGDKDDLADGPVLSTVPVAEEPALQEGDPQEADAEEDGIQEVAFEDAKKAKSPMPAKTAEAPAEAPPVSRISSLKPVDQPKLDMQRTGEDVDLDIPAFLRRQVN